MNTELFINAYGTFAVAANAHHKRHRTTQHMQLPLVLRVTVGSMRKSSREGIFVSLAGIPSKVVGTVLNGKMLSVYVERMIGYCRYKHRN